MTAAVSARTRDTGSRLLGLRPTKRAQRDGAKRARAAAKATR